MVWQIPEPCPSNPRFDGLGIGNKERHRLIEEYLVTYTHSRAGGDQAPEFVLWVLSFQQQSRKCMRNIGGWGGVGEAKVQGFGACA